MQGSVVESDRSLEKKGTRRILCRTCLDHFGPMDSGLAQGTQGKAREKESRRKVKGKSPRAGKNPIHGLGKVLAPWAGLEPAT